MTINRRDYADGTYVVTRSPWDTFTSAAAMCTDGKVRRVSRISATADTFFSVPASVKVNGKTVAGYITFSTRAGYSTETADDPTRVEFHAYTYRKNHTLLPSTFTRSA
jgi:hypothetical protein